VPDFFVFVLAVASFITGAENKLSLCTTAKRVFQVLQRASFTYFKEGLLGTAKSLFLVLQSVCLLEM
jgi:hypothetical protein